MALFVTLDLILFWDQRNLDTICGNFCSDLEQANQIINSEYFIVI